MSEQQIKQQLQDFLKRKNVHTNTYTFSSIDLVAFAVDVEKEFKIQFSLDEIDSKFLCDQQQLLKIITEKKRA